MFAAVASSAAVRNLLQGVASILAAMAPCSRLYGYIGCQLAASGQPHCAYQAWIDTYSSSQYLSLPAIKEGLLDQLGAQAEGGELEFDR